MKRTMRMLSLLLALTMCFGVLVSCKGNGGGGGNDGGDREGDGWEGVDFKGQDVNFCLSVNRYNECSFPAASVYTKGPNEGDSNEVTKEVLARNKRAEDALGIKIVYNEKDWTYDIILQEVRQMVSRRDTVDIINNDIYGLARCMVDGLLWNVKNPGDNVQNYFDFSKEGWYTEFIKGCTFDQNKLYLFAGDYFIDMIRMAWVIYVNNSLLERSLNGANISWLTSVNKFYDFVGNGEWYIDTLTTMSRAAHIDGGVKGQTEKEDERIGFAINHVSDWIFSASSGVTVYYQDENYAPRVMETIDVYQQVADTYVEMVETPGVYFEAEVKSSTTLFLTGRVLFAISRLGEMESADLRNFTDAKGLVPVPKWSAAQEDFHTVIHDQAEIGAILKTARAFSAASALMQYLNEDSRQVVNAYYEKGLKYKYNSDKNAREMMDIVRDTIDSPFGFQIGKICEQEYTGSPALSGLYIENNTTCASTFNSEKGSYDGCMKKMLDKFAKMQ